MIFSELTQLYDSLVKNEKISASEWKDEKVHFAVEIDDDGEIVNLIKLGDGKKPKIMRVPYHPSRSSGVKPFFLYDNAEYLLGIDTKGKPEKTAERLNSSIDYHLNVLKDANGTASKALKKFFEKNKNRDNALNSVIEPYIKDLSTAFLTFYYKGKPITKDNEIIDIVLKSNSNEEGLTPNFCIITGEYAPVAELHPFIKGVAGTQASGATIVSFNAQAFNSYGKEKGENAQTSVSAAKAYGAALNYLLADRDRTFLLGDLTITAWVQNGEKEYTDAVFPFIQDGGITDHELAEVLKRITKGESSDWQGVIIDPDAPFYILGMEPNAGRISVNFFLKDTFGNWVKNLTEHQRRLEIEVPNFVENTNLPIWMILSELKPKGQKTNNSPLTRTLLKSIINNTRYPQELLYSVLKRIKSNSNNSANKPDDKSKKKSERVNWKRAALLKAYLLKNSNNKNIEEVARVSLNTESNSQPYLLGRMFSILETIQEKSSGGTNSTITDQYLTRMCTNPVSVFAKLLELKNAHMKKLKRDNKAAAIALDKQLGDIINKFSDEIPKQLNAEDQAVFMLGYYHQNQKRYEKKQKPESEHKPESEQINMFTEEEE